METISIQFGSGNYFNAVFIAAGVAFVLFSPFFVLKLLERLGRIRKGIAGSAPLWVFVGLGVVLPVMILGLGALITYTNLDDFDKIVRDGDAVVFSHSLKSEVIEIDIDEITKVEVAPEEKLIKFASWIAYTAAFHLEDGRILFSEEESNLQTLNNSLEKLF